MRRVGGKLIKVRSLAAPALLSAIDRAHDPALDDPQRGRHAPLHPGLRRDRDHAGRHLQRGLGRQPAAAVQVADLLRHPARAQPDPPREPPAHRAAARRQAPEPGARTTSRDHPLAPLDVAYHNTLRMFELEGAVRLARVGVRDLADPRRSPGPASSASGSCACWRCWPARHQARRAARRGGSGRCRCCSRLSVVFVNVETPRFREPIDPFLILLAAAGLSARGGPARSPALRRAPVGRRSDRGGWRARLSWSKCVERLA